MPEPRTPTTIPADLYGVLERLATRLEELADELEGAKKPLPALVKPEDDDA
jgi:hypothetical protein